MKEKLEHVLDRMRWEASAHTMEREEEEISEDTLKQAAECFRRGAFADTVRILEAAAPLNAAAMVYLGLAHLGRDDYKAALNAMDQARDRCKEDSAKVEVNRALALSLLGLFDDALEATHRARELAPTNWAPLLSEIMILERRRGQSSDPKVKQADRERVVDIAHELRRRWPDWRSSPAAAYLALDVDYAVLREDKAGEVFSAAFGVHPKELMANKEEEPC